MTYINDCLVQFIGDASGRVLSYNVWPPYICGMLVGGLQLPLVLVMNKTLGGSSSVSFIVAQLFVGPLEKISPYAAKFRRWTMDRYWQVCYTALHKVCYTLSNAALLLYVLSHLLDYNHRSVLCGFPQGPDFQKILGKILSFA